MQLNLPSFPAQSRVKLPSKRIMILGGALLFGGYIIWWLLLWISFSEESVRVKTIAALEKVFKSEVSYTEDTARFSLLPVPRLTLDNVHAKNHARSREPSMVKIFQMTATVNPMSIFSGDLIVSIEMQSPVIELENFDDGSASWDMKLQKDPKASALISEVKIINGRFHYQYPMYERDIVFNEFNASLVFNSADEIESVGSFNLNGSYYQYRLGMMANGAAALNTSLALSDGVSMLNVSGNLDKNTLGFEGTQSFETGDIGNLLQNVYLGKETNNAAAVPAVETAAVPSVLPLKWSSKVSYRDNELTLDDMSIGGDYISGKGLIKVQVSKTPVINARLDLDKLSLQPLMESGVLYKLMTHKDSVEIVEGYTVNLPEGAKTVISKGVTLALTLTGKEAKLLSMDATDIQLVANMEDGFIKLPQFSGKLPGETQFILKGEVEGSYEGVALKGQLDIAGKKFTDFFVKAVGEDIALPKRLKNFRGRTNLFITPVTSRFSEGILRVENMQFLGTLLKDNKELQDKQSEMTAAQTGGVPTETVYEGAIRIDNINLDEIHNVQKIDNTQGMNDYPKIVGVAKKFYTLAKDKNINLKLNLLNFRLKGKIRPKANVNVILDKSGVAFNNIDTSYNGTQFTGSLGISFPPQAVPQIEADVRADIVDTAELFEHNFLEDENFWRDENGQWSKKEFQLGWMQKVNGHLNLLVGSLKHEVYEMTNLTLEATLKDSVFQLNSFSTGIWNGQLSLRAQVSSGKLPSMSCGYTFKNIQIEKLRSATDLVGDLTGRVSLSGDIMTSGINPSTAVQNSQGSLAVAASGITITGFNLANMVRAANTVRTVDDIEKLMMFADQGGTTTIDVLRGTVNIGASYLRSPGIVVTTKEGSGSINLQLNLMDWTLNSAITIYLTSLQLQSPPYIRLVFAGPLNRAARTLDTQSLESFIAKQAAERILDTQ